MPTWVLATFGWLFNARIKMPEQCAKIPTVCLTKYIPPPFLHRKQRGVFRQSRLNSFRPKLTTRGEARTASFERNTVHRSAQRSRRFTGARVRWGVGWLKSTRGGVSLERNKGGEARPVRVLQALKCPTALMPETTTTTNPLPGQHRLITDA